MTSDRDPKLQELFAIAKDDLSEEHFTSQVMSQVDTQRRRKIIAWTAIGLLLAPLAWSLATLVQDAVFLLTQTLPSTLIDIDDRWLAQALAPLNSIGSLVALGLLGLRLAYKKIF